MKTMGEALALKPQPAARRRDHLRRAHGELLMWGERERLIRQIPCYSSPDPGLMSMPTGGFRSKEPQGVESYYGRTVCAAVGDYMDSLPDIYARNVITNHYVVECGMVRDQRYYRARVDVLTNLTELLEKQEAVNART